MVLVGGGAGAGGALASGLGAGGPSGTGGEAGAAAGIVAWAGVAGSATRVDSTAAAAAPSAPSARDFDRARSSGKRAPPPPIDLALQCASESWAGNHPAWVNGRRAANCAKAQLPV